MNETSPREMLRYATWVVFKHKMSILGVLVFTVLCFAVGTFLVTPLWQATAKLIVMQDPKQQMILFGDLQAPVSSDNRASAMDLVEILTGNDLARKVVTEFQLDERMRRKAQEPETLSETAKYWIVQVVNSPRTLLVELGLRDKSEPNFFEKALDELIEDMEDIELIEETSTITLSIWADDRELAVDICNYMVDYLAEKTKGFERTEAVATYEFVTKQLESVEQALHDAEEEVFRFKESNGIVELAAERTMLLSRLDALSTQSGLQQARLAALNAKLDELESQLGGPVISPGGASANASQEGSQYARYRNAINERETEKDILLTKVDVMQVKGEFDSLQSNMAGIQAQLAGFNTMELELERLMRSSAGLRERYMNLRGKQLALEVQKFTENSQFDIKVADAAYIPPRAQTDWPSWGVNLAAGLLFGVVFAFGQAFFFEYWRDALYDADEIAEACGVEVLGAVRSISVKRVSRQLQREMVRKSSHFVPYLEEEDEDSSDHLSSEETLSLDVAPTTLARSKREVAEAVAAVHSETL